MANPTFTPELILETIEAMHLEGVKINLRTIHKRLGGGSFSSISPVLKQWRNEQKPDDHGIPDVPENVRNIMDKTVQILWQATWQAMAESESSELCAVKDDMLQRDIDHEVLESDYLNQQNRIEELERAVETGAAMLTKTTTDLIDVRCLLAAEQEKSLSTQVLLTQQQQSRDAVLVELATEREKLAALQERFQSLMQELDKVKEINADLAEKNTCLKELIDEQKQELNESIQAMSQADIRLAGVSSDLIVCREERDALANELSQKNELLDEQSQKYQELQLVNAQQKKQLKELEKTVSSEKQQAKEIEADLKEMKSTLKVEQEANRIARESIESMCNSRIEAAQRECELLRTQLQKN